MAAREAMEGLEEMAMPAASEVPAVREAQEVRPAPAALAALTAQQERPARHSPSQLTQIWS